jgi:hypothetical protein
MKTGKPGDTRFQRCWLSKVAKPQAASGTNFFIRSFGHSVIDSGIRVSSFGFLNASLPKN